METKDQRKAYREANKEKIKEYLDYCSKFGFINDFVFQVILGNAVINYL